MIYAFKRSLCAVRGKGITEVTVKSRRLARRLLKLFRQEMMVGWVGVTPRTKEEKIEIQ